MVRKLVVVVMILVLNAICFGQNDVEDAKRAFVEFWTLALENKPADAKKLISEDGFASLNFRTIESIDRISINRIKIEGVTRRTINTKSAYFELTGIDSANRSWEAQVLLKKETGGWRVVVLNVLRGQNSDFERKPLMPKTKPLQLVPNFPKGYPMKVDCPKCI